MEKNGEILVKSFKSASKAQTYISNYQHGNMIQKKGSNKRQKTGIHQIIFCCNSHVKCKYYVKWIKTENGVNLYEKGVHGSIPIIKTRGINPYWREQMTIFAQDKLTCTDIYNRIKSICDNDAQMLAIVPKKNQIKSFLSTFNSKLSEKKKGNLDEFYNFEGWCKEKPRFVESYQEFCKFATDKSKEMIVIGSFHEKDKKTDKIRRTVVLTTHALFSNIKRSYQAYSIKVKNQMHLLTDGKHKVEVRGWMFIPFGTSTRYFDTDDKLIKQKFIPFVYTFGKSETKRLFFKTKQIIIDSAKKFLGIDDLYFNIFISDHSDAIYGGLMAESMPDELDSNDSDNSDDNVNDDNDDDDNDVNDVNDVNDII